MAMAGAPGSFYAICQQTGLTLGINGDSIGLNVEPTRFQREVARLIRHSPLGADCTESFLEGLQEYLEDAQNLKACLMPIAGPSHQGSSYVGMCFFFYLQRCSFDRLVFAFVGSHCPRV